MHNQITIEKVGKNYHSNVKQVRVVPGGNHYTLEIIYEIPDAEMLPDNNRYCCIGK